MKVSRIQKEQQMAGGGEKDKGREKGREGGRKGQRKEGRKRGNKGHVLLGMKDREYRPNI